MRGLSLQVNACKNLVRVLKDEPDFQQGLKDIIQEIRNRIGRKDITTSIITEDIISNLVAYMTTDDSDLQEESTKVFDAYNTPRIQFDERRRAYHVVKNASFKLHGEASSKARMYRERFVSVQQRLLRSGGFTLRTSVGSSSSANSVAKHVDENLIELSTVESLLGDIGTRILLGFLVQPEEGVWHLEDAGAMVPIDLSEAVLVSDPIVVHGSIVIVEGVLVDGVFRVSQLGVPPAESRDETLRKMGVGDPLGNESREQLEEKLRLEQSADDTQFIIISEIHMDKEEVVIKLSKVFAAYEEYADEEASTAPEFVLIGSFVSHDSTRAGGRQAHEDAFRRLADLIKGFPNLSKKGKFTIAPGPADLGLGAALPRRRLPSIVETHLKTGIKNLRMVSNPFRIRFYTHEMVFFREDLSRKMQRNTVRIGNNPQVDTDSEVFDRVVMSLISQGHMLPLPLETRPVYWELDHSLRLEPLPHLLVLADRADQAECEKTCNAVNPGSFSADGSFLVYYPASRTSEFSRV
jgi:DNA polymerase epsilon subunit 2